MRRGWRPPSNVIAKGYLRLYGDEWIRAVEKSRAALGDSLGTFEGEPEGNLHVVTGRDPFDPFDPFDEVVRGLTTAMARASRARSNAVETRLEAREIVRESRSLRESGSLRREQAEATLEEASR